MTPTALTTSTRHPITCPKCGSTLGTRGVQGNVYPRPETRPYVDARGRIVLRCSCGCKVRERAGKVAA